MAKLEASTLGMANLPLVVLPHPIGTLPEDQARAIATSAFDAIAEKLTRA